MIFHQLRGKSLKKAAVLFLFAFVMIPVQRLAAQQSEDIHATGSNSLRVGSGSTTDGSTTTDKRYFEEIANARLFFQNFAIGLRYEMDDPSEVGRSYNDKAFRRRWITYRKDQLEIQGGDVSALFGRGLAVNLFESRPLNYDSWLDGVFAKSETKIPKEWVDLDMTLALKGVGGKEDFYPVPLVSTDSAFAQHISARAVNAEVGLFKHKVILGTSFLEAENNGDYLNLGQTFANQTNQPELYADINLGDFAGFFNWTENRTTVSEVNGSAVDTSHTGHAVYSSLSYSNSIFGLTMEYKNYSYFLHNRGDIYEGAFSKSPLSSPPEVYKDFTYTTISRTTHGVIFDDEVGMQAEANITAIPHVTLNLYGSASSSHDKYGTYYYDSVRKRLRPDPSRIVDSLSVLPNLKDNGFYPFWEGFAEAEWEFDPDNDLNYVRFALHRRSEVIAYIYSDTSAEVKMETTMAAKIQYMTAPNQSILAIIEHQWSNDGTRPSVDKRTLNDIITLQYSFNPLITFGGLADFSIQYENMPYHIEDSWFQGFVSLRLGGSHTLLTSFGSERGGINCTGGICRVVPPFKGLRLSLTSQI